MAVLAYVLADRRDEFATALSAAPRWVLAVATALQLLALVSRTEAWRICVAAAGGTGVHASLFDATAVPIAMVTLSQLPIGPSVGAAGVDRLWTLRVAPVPVRAAEG